jgi:hypothetical protein
MVQQNYIRRAASQDGARRFGKGMAEVMGGLEFTRNDKISAGAKRPLVARGLVRIKVKMRERRRGKSI